MKFEFNGQEFDTDKPICVLGYTITKKSWFSYSRFDSWGDQKIQEYGAKVRKLYVKGLYFKMIDGVNVIWKAELTTSTHDRSEVIDSNNIIGHSPQECMKLYKAMREAAE